MSPTEIALFQDVKIRKILHDKEWFFSVVDVVGVLTESTDPRKYWNKLAERLRDEGSELVTICHQLKLEAPDGKKYATDCANTEGILRIIQTIPSPKAEPFKRWLAKVGYERIKEIENPELVVDRIRKTYLAKGYPEEWIETRLSSMRSRNELTNEWVLR